MKFDKNLAAIHGYLCSDGYVIKNPDSQKHKYYYMGLRNTNKVLLSDFQKKFEASFGMEPIITNEGRCKIQNKEIYELLTQDFSFYSYEWELPELRKDSLSCWLRAFFDCEGWVENQPAKSRLIGADCCNETGLLSVREALKKFNIASEIKKKRGRNIWRLTICGIEDLKKFKEYINFLHPDKSQKLNEAISSYKDYCWAMPEDKKSLIKFIFQKGRLRKERNEIKFLSIKSKNITNLRKVLNK